MKTSIPPVATARMNRRQFLQRTAGTVCAAAPLIIPASALGRAGPHPA